MINNEALEILSVAISKEIKNLQVDASRELNFDNGGEVFELLINTALQKSYHNVLTNILKEIERRDQNGQS